MMWKALAAAVLVIIGLIVYADYLSARLEEANRALEAAAVARQTQERINNADTSVGNPDDDTRWLCEYAGLGNCGP